MIKDGISFQEIQWRRLSNIFIKISCIPLLVFFSSYLVFMPYILTFDKIAFIPFASYFVSYSILFVHYWKELKQIIDSIDERWLRRVFHE